MVLQTYTTASQSGISQIAYQFEVPMLVTNVGGLAEVVAHNKVGYVVEKSPEQIANYILDFFENNKYDEFSKNLQKEKSNYSWSSFTQELIKLYEKVKK